MGQYILMEVLAVAAVFSTIVIIAGWQRRREWLQRQGQPTPPDRFELGQTPLASGVIDVAAEIAQVLRRLDHVAARQFVALESAVDPGLVVRADQRAFREILHDMITNAIDQSPGGRVLAAAARTGGRVQITVSDDGIAANRPLRASQLRSAERLAAMHGATLDIHAREGQGTTVVLSLPVSVNGSRPESPDPAAIWTSAVRQKNGAATQ